MKHILAAAAALPLVLLITERAEADTCKRWVNQLGPCDGLVAQNVCNTSSAWTPNQWINYKNWIYSSTPEKACKKMVEKSHPGYEDKTAVQMITPSYYICYYDYNNDGVVNGVDYSATASPISQDDIQKDDCCSLVPNGRYGDDLGFATISAGGQFTYEQRQDILDLNRVPYAYNPNTGQTLYLNKSDAAKAGVTDTGTNILQTLAVTQSSYYYPDDMHPDYPLTHAPPPGTGDAQIDHIIPRIDSNGCGCGDNSFRNAAVISGGLNSSMGRSCLDPRRAKFLEKWTLPAGSPSPAPTYQNDGVDPVAGLASEEPEAEITETSGTGGCSAAHGGTGWILTVLGAAAIVGRRRRN